MAPWSMTAAAMRRPSCRSRSDDDPVFVDQLLLQALGDDGLAHRLAHPSAQSGARRCSVMSPANNTGTTTFNQYGALAALTPEGDAFREQIARALRRRIATWWRISSPARTACAGCEPDGAFYGYPASRRPEGQSGLRQGSGAARQCRHGAGLGVRPGRSARRGLCAHLLRARPGRRAGAKAL